MIKKVRKNDTFVALLILAISASTFFASQSSYAYTISQNGGIYYVPTIVEAISSFDPASHTAIQNACTTWNNTLHGTLLTKGPNHSSTIFPNSNNNKNQITKNTENSQTYAGKTIKRSSFFLLTYVMEADININTKYMWSNNGTSGTYDVQSVMTHELGHVLGMGDEPTLFASTMYKDATTGDISRRTLENDDLIGLDTIY